MLKSPSATPQWLIMIVYSTYMIVHISSWLCSNVYLYQTPSELHNCVYVVVQYVVWLIAEAGHVSSKGLGKSEPKKRLYPDCYHTARMTEFLNTTEPWSSPILSQHLFCVLVSPGHPPWQISKCLANTGYHCMKTSVDSSVLHLKVTVAMSHSSLTPLGAVFSFW